MHNWKALGKDGVWILVEKPYIIALMYTSVANHILHGERPLPGWMTVLYQKDIMKGSAVDSYRPISCVPLMLKLMTGMLAEKMFSYLERENVIPKRMP